MKRPSRSATDIVGFHPDGFHVTERLVVEELKRGRRHAVSREADLALLRILAQIGNEEAAFAKGEFPV